MTWLTSGSNDTVMAKVQEELIGFSEKYNTLKRRLKQIEKDNTELVMENGIL